MTPPPRNFNTAFVDERLREHWQMQARRAEELEREIRDEVLREAAGIEAPFVCDAPPLRRKNLCRRGAAKRKLVSREVK